MTNNHKAIIEDGKAVLGIELGSTRIKCCLIDESKTPFISGEFEWQNQLVDGIWTYAINDIWEGLQKSYADLVQNVQMTYQVPLRNLKALGISAMMHGYLVFDENDQLLVPFRTWRNCISSEAANYLTKEFNYNIPERWSIAHFYQAVLNNETHVSNVAFMTTLSGYIHWQLTGKKVLGVGDASGMFPINDQTHNYDEKMLSRMDELLAEKNLSNKIEAILPKVLLAGELGGYLTEEGAKRLDTLGQLEAGIPLCPPEGDAGTGMVATNTISQKQGNVSAGTSIFAMFVLEQALKNVYPEIDIVTTPDGSMVAMVHGNNCSTDINNWIRIFDEFAKLMGYEVTKEELYEKLFTHSLNADPNAGGLLNYGYYSGEPLSGVIDGRPLMLFHPNADFNLANFIQSHLFSSFSVLSLGMDILTTKEKVVIDKVFAHGGLFKTEAIAQKALATVLDKPVSVMNTAGEGGAWGIALLADYLTYAEQGMTLPEYLAKFVFEALEEKVIKVGKNEREGYLAYFEQYQQALPLAQQASRYI